MDKKLTFVEMEEYTKKLGGLSRSAQVLWSFIAKRISEGSFMGRIDILEDRLKMGLSEDELYSAIRELACEGMIDSAVRVEEG